MVVRPHRVFLRRPAIRTLVMLWAGSALLTWAILVGGWFVARHHLVRIDTQVVDDIRGLDATRRLESALLVFRHDELPGMSDAVKHSPPHTCVTLRVEREDSQAVLSISGQGPGIPADDWRILFQRTGPGSYVPDPTASGPNASDSEPTRGGGRPDLALAVRRKKRKRGCLHFVTQRGYTI